MKRILLCFSAIMLAGTIRAQWPNNFLLTSGNTFFGTQFNAPIDIYTNGLQRAQFTTNNGLGANSLIPGIGLGDGLKIIHKTNGCGIVSTPQASVDIWTSCSNGTNIRWDGSGQISGTNNRFEMWANYFGLFFNTSSPNGRYKFARLGAVTGYVGTNNFWRIGMQADSDNLNGQRRLHVVDNEVQFRLSYAQPGTNSVFFTDFLSNSVGNLQIQPSGGRVGVNANANPTATLDVFGNARIRNVQAETPNSILIGVNANGPSDVNVRRLDFTGNSNQVLLGNGTWGTLPPTNPPVTLPAANNGVSRYTLLGGNNPYQLGDQYDNVFWLFNTNTPLTVDRQVRLNGKNFVFSGEGRVGIGLSYPVMPTELLDVNGNGRFRKLPDVAYQADASVTKIVMVDDNGVLRWSPNVPSQFGADCSDPVNGMLNNDKKVVLNNNNLYFTNPTNSLNFNENKIGIGYICNTNLPAKFAVRQLHDQTVSLGTTAGHFYNRDVANTILLTFTGVHGVSEGVQDPSLRPINIGGKFTSRNSGVNHGINIDITNNALSNSINYGIFNRVEDFNASSSYGMRSETRGASYHAYGLYVIAAGNYTSNPVQTQQTTGVSVYSFGGSDENIGLRAVSGGDDIGAYSFGGTNFGLKAYAKYGTSNYAVYGETTAGQPNSYAGYFVGPVVQNQPSIPSDQQFKTNVLDIENADSLIASIRPVTYDYQTTGNAVRMNFPSGIQYGMIAQEVESVMPELVKTVEHPAINDSVGNEIEPSFEYKVLNYEAFLPILIAGHQEQAKELDVKDSIIDALTADNATQQQTIDDLNARLTQLENCLSGILPLLCQLSNSAIQANTPAAQEEVRKTLSVTLSNRSAIVLDQNVPNPFAEQTIINFSIPETVQKAQIHFYDANGRFMNSVEVTERGLGSITVFGSDLSTGVYTYTLVVDGQVVATKKMMKH